MFQAFLDKLSRKKRTSCGTLRCAAIHQPTFFRDLVGTSRFPWEGQHNRVFVHLFFCTLVGIFILCWATSCLAFAGRAIRFLHFGLDLVSLLGRISSIHKSTSYLGFAGRVMPFLCGGLSLVSLLRKFLLYVSLPPTLGLQGKRCSVCVLGSIILLSSAKFPLQRELGTCLTFAARVISRSCVTLKFCLTPQKSFFYPQVYLLLWICRESDTILVCWAQFGFSLQKVSSVHEPISYFGFSAKVIPHLRATFYFHLIFFYKKFPQYADLFRPSRLPRGRYLRVVSLGCQCVKYYFQSSEQKYHCCNPASQSEQCGRVCCEKSLHFYIRFIF